ncbi:hypothetical protein HGRIS_003502 [Hohenbuehelia grisea]|uniref:Cytochrome P450 n=1 Tax=Hohenbuehelia grisea TaxID=104357 RepID=A0ABR3JHB7_9AGAR
MLSWILAIVTAFVALAVVLRDKPQQYNLPPGPQGLSFFGLIGSMLPTDRPWIAFTQWAKSYGDIISFHIMGRRIILISSAEAINELFNKNSLNFVNKPPRIMASLCDFTETLPFMDNGPQFRKCRKQFHHELNSAAIAKHTAVIESEVQSLLQNIARQPSKFEDDLYFAIGKTLLRLTLGYNVSDKNDRLLTYAESVSTNAAIAMMPGVFLVDRMPFLRHMPSWLPGGGFKKVAAQWRQELYELVDKTFKSLEQQKGLDDAQEHLMASMLRSGDFDDDPDAQRNIKFSAVTIYAAGILTIQSFLLSFCLAMTHFPLVQREAQAEIDSIVGRKRLPTLADKENLPYVQCLMKELMRWNPVVPLLSRKPSEDFKYGQYDIPSSATIIANAWAITRDPELFPDPDKFEPKRFMPCDSGGKKHEIPDPTFWTFGFGRRVCPGQDLAESFTFVAVVQLLATFDIRPVMDEEGRPKLPKIIYTTEAASRPMSFDCDIRLRPDANGFFTA